MRISDCERCGANDFIETADSLTCSFCRSKYVGNVSSPKAPDTRIELSEDIRSLLDKCESDPSNSHRYANLVLDLDPNNKEALEHLYPKD